jgi:hypothetical protein
MVIGQLRRSLSEGEKSTIRRMSNRPKPLDLGLVLLAAVPRVVTLDLAVPEFLFETLDLSLSADLGVDLNQILGMQFLEAHGAGARRRTPIRLRNYSRVRGRLVDARIVGWLTPVAHVVSLSGVRAHGTGLKCSSAWSTSSSSSWWLTLNRTAERHR